MSEEAPEAIAAAFYRRLLRREPDPDGLAHYAAQLADGMSVDQLLDIFLSSDEYRSLVRTAGWGALPPRVGDADAGDGAVRSAFPADYAPPGEAGRSYQVRRRNGFLDRYCAGARVLDVGYVGYDNPERLTALPNAIGVGLDYPGYDGLHLPFADGSVDTVFSSHCLEHILADHAAIRDWYRVLRIGGFIVCMVPSQALYEKKRFLPSRYNEDHKRMYTPASLLRAFEEALEVNSYRVRHVAENDRGFDYRIGPERHSDGAYEIELVVEKIVKPGWDLT